MYENARKLIVVEANRLERISRGDPGAPHSALYHVGARLLKAIALGVHPNLDVVDTYFTQWED